MFWFYGFVACCSISGILSVRRNVRDIWDLNDFANSFSNFKNGNQRVREQTFGRNPNDLVNSNPGGSFPNRPNDGRNPNDLGNPNFGGSFPNRPNIGRNPNDQGNPNFGERFLNRPNIGQNPNDQGNPNFGESFPNRPNIGRDPNDLGNSNFGGNFPNRPNNGRNPIEMSNSNFGGSFPNRPNNGGTWGRQDKGRPWDVGNDFNWNTNGGFDNGGMQTTTPAIPGMGTTFSPCEQRCQTTSQHDPVCGTNGMTYENMGRLNCAVTCGIQVQMDHLGGCPRRAIQN